MKKILVTGFSLFAFLCCQSQQTNQGELSKLKALNAKFIHNFVTNDTVSHSKIIHTQFVCVTSDGRTVSKMNI